jgi:hydrogenase nickel incorporation protein HypA/HybF
MHELSIAEQILDTVLEAASLNNVIKVESVDLEIGEMQLVVHDALQMGWEALSMETIAEGSKLNISEKKILLECSSCSARYGAEIGHFICPECNEATGKAIEGNEILVTAITCDAEEGEEI